MPAYYPAVPEIAKAYDSDPRNKIAIALQQQAMSGAPVASGQYAWLDGLTRVASGVLGKRQQDRMGAEYGKREGKYQNEIAKAFGNQQAAPPTDVAAALAPPAAPPPMTPQAPQQAMTPPPQPSPPPQGGMSPMSGQGVPQPLQQVDPDQAAGMMPQGLPQPPMGAQPQGREGAGVPPFSGTTPPNSAAFLFTKGIVPIEGGTARDGSFRTSPKGAFGPSQLMPATAPEALALAGYSRDDPRWRTDAKVNLEAGQAYYQKQLQDFGDPIKAAAAYNAGGGRVRRAIRRASVNGGEWTDYLPGETKAYVRNFADKVGAAAAGGGVEAPGNTPAQMEPVPEGMAAPSAMAPEAPKASPAVQSSKLRIAQRLLQSRNPDVFAMGQRMIQDGLDQQFKADGDYASRSDDANARGYNTAATDWTGSRSDYRGQQRQDRSNAQERNFGRENREDNQQYGTSERIGTQGFQAGESATERAFREKQAGLDRAATAANLERQIEGKRVTAREANEAKRANFSQTPTGRKIEDDTVLRMQGNNVAIGKLDRFEAANAKQPTGGIYKIPGVGAVAEGLGDDEISEMRTIANELTLGANSGLKGATSDKDIAFLQGTQPNIGRDKASNTKIIGAYRRAYERMNEFEQGKLDAQAVGDVPNFMRTWQAYVNSTSIQDNKAPSYAQWSANNIIDARGRK